MSTFNDTSRDVSSAHLACSDVPDHHRAAAVRIVASLAHDADDCGQLLDMLGLAAAECLTGQTREAGA